MSEFELIKKLGLMIHQTRFESLLPSEQVSYVCASSLEILLEKGVRVSGYQLATIGWLFGDCTDPNEKSSDTHTGLIIDIKPIVKDSAESLLRELIDDEFTQACAGYSDHVRSVKERAKAFLGRGK